MSEVSIHQAFIIPPPPPPHLPSVELPVSGIKLEATHAEQRMGVLDSIKQSGGYGKISLRHVPPSEQHTPGNAPPPSLLSKPLPKGGGGLDLMGDLNAALLKRKTGGGRGGGAIKMGHTMRMLGACAPSAATTPKKQPASPQQPPDDQDATDF